MGNTDKEIQSTGWIMCVKCKGRMERKSYNVFVCSCGKVVKYPDNLKLLNCQICDRVVVVKTSYSKYCSICSQDKNRKNANSKSNRRK